ncbi:MAG TPA: FliA/WhiG family RNA polymerase sigma factor [Bryobacteraceae bacterium]|nr:FliA/WhiG family RNA polymerase sigma factor [Bryobacteraceae bacterium]
MGRLNGTARNKEAGALAARDQLVLENLSLVKAIAIRVHENLPVHVDLDDLVHAGVLGLFDAASKYNPDKQVIFQGYAKHRIKGAILDSLRQLDWASRDLRKRQKQLDSATHDLMARLGRTPTEQEIADKLGLGIERWRRVARELKNLGLISPSALRADPENSAPIEFPAAPDSQPDRICARQQLRSALAGALKDLPKRYQKVVFLYYTNEMTMKEIGEVMGVNESRVSQIHKIALEKMAASLRSAGIESAGAFQA